MIRRTWILATIALLLLSTMSFRNGAIAQSDASPESVERGDLINEEMFQESVLASSDIDRIIADEPRLILELIEFAAGAALPAHIAVDAEILVVDSGDIAIEDSFGFSSTVNAGQTIALAAASEYELANAGDAPATVFRLRLGDDEAANATPDAIGSSTSITTLLDYAIADSPSGATSLFVGRLTFFAGDFTDRLLHTGPLGLYVEQGTLSVTSPSGVVGEVVGGSGVMLPASAPLTASNESAEIAVLMFVGLAEVGEPVVSEFVPTPTPTNTPTMTPIPTETPIPTATTAPTETPVPTSTTAPTETPVPTNTPEPTQTPEPTATSTPTEVPPTQTPEPTPEPGELLFEAEGEDFDDWAMAPGWFYVDGLLVTDGREESDILAPFDTTGTSDIAIEAEIQLVTLDTCFSRFGLRARVGDQGGGYSAQSKRCDYDSSQTVMQLFPNIPDLSEVISFIQFDPGPDWHSYRLEVQGNKMTVWIDGALAITSTDNRFLSAGRVGLFARDSQINVRRFAVYAAGGEPNASSNDSSTSTDTDTAAADSASIESTDQNASSILVGWLPTDADVPEWLVMSDDRSRTLDEVASNYDDIDATIGLFESWGWQGNAIRTFEVENPESYNDVDVGAIYASVHAFADAESAQEAVDYSLGVQASGVPGAETYADSYGDYCLVIFGSMDYGDEITFLIQQDNLMIRLSASSAEGDPTDQARNIVDSIMSRNAQGDLETISVSSTDSASEDSGDTSLIGNNQLYIDLSTLLPTENELLDGLVMIEEGSLGVDTITSSFSDPASAASLFDGWGWQANAFRYFEASDGDATEDGLVYVDIGVHQFSSEPGAAEALDYFCDVRQEQLRITELSVNPVGDQSRVISGSTDMGTEATVYTRVGGVVVRISVMSIGTDPVPVAFAIAGSMVSKLN